jgi:DNA-binding LacI/PurR family transcriptional regulator
VSDKRSSSEIVEALIANRVVGVEARVVTPSLTTIHQDEVGLGATAIEVMTRILEHPDSTPPSSVLPVELTIRDSTSGAPARDGAGRA